MKGVKAMWLYVLLGLISFGFFVNGWRHFIAGCGLKRISEDVKWPKWLKAARMILQTERREDSKKHKDTAAIRGDLHVTYSTAWWVLTGIVLTCLNFINN